MAYEEIFQHKKLQSLFYLILMGGEVSYFSHPKGMNVMKINRSNDEKFLLFIGSQLHFRFEKTSPTLCAKE